MEAPKIFISYSWKPQTNKNKVLELAERLQLNGVHVIVDEWDLKEGHDKYTFMEQMVNKKDVSRVLLICNKEYMEKANQKTGGVGVESMIVSDDIYQQVEQTKFIPIVFERADDGKEYLPTFVKTRIYIDLSSDDRYEEEYEKLLRNIFEKPASRRPPLGVPPPYIVEEIQSTLRTAHKVVALKNAIINEKKNINVLIADYYSTFLLALNDYRIVQADFTPGRFMDEIVFSKIEAMRPLRNDFVKFIDTICTLSESIDLEKLHDFWQSLIEFFVEDESYRVPESNQNACLIMDHFKFFFRELFLYQITQFLEKKKFEAIQFLLYNPYIIYSTRLGLVKPQSYITIRGPLRSFVLRNERLGLREISLTANKIKERTSDSTISFEKLKETDILLYYISIMNADVFKNYNMWHWFPELSVFPTYNISFTERMISKRFFEKAKVIFNVGSVEELENKVKKTAATDNETSRWDSEMPFMERIFDFNKIASIP